MKKIPFTEKNNLVVRHKNLSFFSKDLELFKKHCPSHALNNDLARANQHTFAALDGQMLAVLLNYIPIDDILEHRGLKEKKTRTLDELKTLIIGFNILNFVNPDTFYTYGDKKLEELNTIEDETEIKAKIDDFVNPKIETIDEVKCLFILQNLNIEGVPDSLFEDFIGKPVSGAAESIIAKYGFMENKPDDDEDLYNELEEITEDDIARVVDIIIVAYPDSQAFLDNESNIDYLKTLALKSKSEIIEAVRTLFIPIDTTNVETATESEVKETTEIQQEVIEKATESAIPDKKKGQKGKNSPK